MIIYSFVFFLMLFVLIGVASSIKSKNSNSDYLLAGQNVSPWLAALSAAFGPILLIYAIGKKVSEINGILMIINAMLVTLLWRTLGWGSTIYEVAPGMIAGLLTYILISKTKWNKVEYR